MTILLYATVISVTFLQLSLGLEQAHHVVRRQTVMDATVGCGSTKGCFRNPEGCSGSNCETAVSFVEQGDHIKFVVATQIPSTLGPDFYVSIGFSRDNSMGKDSVIDCMRSGNTISIKASYNPGKNNQLLTNPTLGLSQMSGQYENGFLVCSFSREKSVAVTGSDAGKIYNLTSPNSYILFVAKGSVLNGSKQMHSQIPHISSSKIDFSRVTGPPGSSAPSSHHQYQISCGWSLVAVMVLSMYLRR